MEEFSLLYYLIALAQGLHSGQKLIGHHILEVGEPGAVISHEKKLMVEIPFGWNHPFLKYLYLD